MEWLQERRRGRDWSTDDQFKEPSLQRNGSGLEGARELCGDGRSYRNVYAERNGGLGRGKLTTEGMMTTALISRRDAPAMNSSTSISSQP